MLGADQDICGSGLYVALISNPIVVAFFIGNGPGRTWRQEDCNSDFTHMDELRLNPHLFQIFNSAVLLQSSCLCLGLDWMGNIRLTYTGESPTHQQDCSTKI